jgi:EAL domain-containing protein (putative c-di-GMP-specific phosphodiesterase class I)
MERPDVFIPLAEETGQLFALGDTMLEQAGRLVAAIDEHLDFFPVGVTLNVSAVQLVHEDLVDRVRSFLESRSLDPAMLQLEITERMAMRDPETAIKTCIALRKLGVRLAIDDFGTGHSSLSHLQRFPVSTVKIDKSFVRNLHVKVGKREIVRAIMALTHALGLEVIAEGIERREEHNALLALGCKRGQGFLYSPALDHDAALAIALQEAPSESGSFGTLSELGEPR